MVKARARFVYSLHAAFGNCTLCPNCKSNLSNTLSSFGAILWVDLDSKTTAEKSFLEIADKLSITASTSTDVCVGIANLKYSWLLVLDNADEPDIDYQNYFPDGQLGVIIMTTRNDECHQYSTGEVVALEGLHDTDAQELLLKAARVQPSQHYLYADQAKTVVNLLQSHSLALIQAGVSDVFRFPISFRHLEFCTFPCIGWLMFVGIRCTRSVHNGRVSSPLSTTAPTFANVSASSGSIALPRCVCYF